MILDRVLPSRKQLSSDEAPGYGWFYALMQGVNRSASGINISAESAMRQATVFACVKVLAETIAQFPIHVYRRLPNGQKDLAPKHPLNIILGLRPNRWQTSFEFREMLMGHLALRGNAYARIIPGDLGAVTELWPLNPDKMKVQRLDSWRLLYIYTNPDGSEDKYSQDEIMHLRGMTSDGLVGLSPLSLARDTIGNALAAERFQGKLFSNAAMPSGYLTTGNAMKVADAKTAQASFMEAYSGENNWHKPMVLWGGLEWKQIGMTNEDTQFMDLRKMSRTEICAIFRMPPHKISDLERATFSNIEESNIQFVVDTILPWARRWEEIIGRDLIADDETFYVRFNFDSLLRGNAAARAALYHAGVNDGWLCPNEVRQYEDLPPYEGGETFFIQGAMVPVETAINPPTQPPPAGRPPQLGEDGTASDAQKQNEQAAARQWGEILGKQEFMRMELGQAIASLAEKDQQVSEQKDRARLAELDTEATRAKLLEATAAGTETAAALEALRTEHSTAVTERSEARQQLMDSEIARASKESEITKLREAESAASLAAAEHSDKLAKATEDNGRLIAACAARMLAIEVEGIERALRKPNGIALLDKFYEKHADRLTIALSPLIEQRAILCECRPTSEIVAQYVAESKRQLLEAFNGPNETAADRIADCVAGWDSTRTVL